MHKTISHWGAQRIMTIKGDAKKLSGYVTRLFNCGIVSSIPDNFIAGESDVVRLTTSEKRLEKGFYAVASTFCRRHYPVKGTALLLAIHLKAENLRAQFVRVENHMASPKRGRVYGTGDTHEGIGFNNTFVSE